MVAQKVNTESPSDPGIPILGIDPRGINTNSHTKTHTQRFIRSRIYNGPKVRTPSCPAMDE